jgi:replicative superfamily II helicase
MPVDPQLQTQWEAFLKLIQVKEARLFDHLKKGRIKEITKYNVILASPTPELHKEIEVGLKVYHDKITELVPTIFGGNRGIKAELVSEAEWEAISPAAKLSAAPANLSSDQNELLKVLEGSIRQKIEAELRATLEAEMASGKGQEKLLARVREDIEEEESQHKVAMHMALTAEGDKALERLMSVWQQAKQSGEGGESWLDVKKCLLELLDTTVQLTQS